MKLNRLVACAILIASLPAFASSGPNEDACRDKGLAAADRLTACAAFVDAAQEIEDRVRALVYFAQAYRQGEDFEAALNTVDMALELRPADDFALGEKGVILGKLERYDAALAVFDQLIKVDPDDPWNPYYKGVILRRKLDFEAALAAYDAALAIDANYYWALLGRAQVLDKVASWAEAGAAFEKVLALKPLETKVISDAGWAFKSAGMADRAAYHYRMLLTLTPNRLDVRDWLNGYVGEPATPVLDPLPWRAPPLNRTIRYLRVYAPVDTRDEMEISIDELFAWFGGTPRPVPLGASVFEARIDAVDHDTLVWHQRGVATSGAKIPAEPPTGMFRGIFANTYLPLGPKAPPVVMRFGATSPAEVWPLAVGNAASSTGEFRTICPDQPSIPARMLGCVEGVDGTKRGTLSWNLSVDRSERVHVPMGWFDTYVLHFTLSGGIALVLGRPKPVNQDIWLWYAPALDTFVRREVMLGETYILDQAMAIIDADDQGGEP